MIVTIIVIEVIIALAPLALTARRDEESAMPRHPAASPIFCLGEAEWQDRVEPIEIDVLERPEPAYILSPIEPLGG